MSQYDPSKRKPKVIFNEYGKRVVDVHESNIYANYLFVEAIKNLPQDLINEYKQRVQHQKDEEKNN